VLYAGPVMAPAAYKWKISLNENSKNVAWWNEYPEWNHNETSGWIGQPLEKPYSVVELRSILEHERVQKRMELMERLLSGNRPTPEVVQAQGDGALQQVLWTVMFGDFVSLYLALANNIDPSPVDLQEKLKIELNK
jgi:glucose/mannose-6-phosphate isomerase